MVDMYVVGKYNGAETITAVSVGSQIMHMITVMTAGFTMGITVRVGKAAGEHDLIARNGLGQQCFTSARRSH